MPAGFLFTAPRSAVLKLESQTCHDIEGCLRVVVRKITPHISIGCIGSVAQVSELHKPNQALHIAAVPSVRSTCVNHMISG